MKKIVLILCAGYLVFVSGAVLAEEVIRVGYFPNITHAQVLIGIANGQFQKALGENVRIESKVFNAGPSAVEALFADAIDMAYIGPSPSINAYVKTNGQF